MRKRTETKLTRIDPSFREEMDSIREARINLKKDSRKKFMSDRRITSLIPKHTFWKDIKEDLIEYDGE